LQNGLRKRAGQFRFRPEIKLGLAIAAADSSRYPAKLSVESVTDDQDTSSRPARSSRRSDTHVSRKANGSATNSIPNDSESDHVHLATPVSTNVVTELAGSDAENAFPVTAMLDNVTRFSVADVRCGVAGPLAVLKLARL